MCMMELRAARCNEPEGYDRPDNLYIHDLAWLDASVLFISAPSVSPCIRRNLWSPPGLEIIWLNLQAALRLPHRFFAPTLASFPLLFSPFQSCRF